MKRIGVVTHDPFNDYIYGPVRLDALNLQWPYKDLARLDGYMESSGSGGPDPPGGGQGGDPPVKGGITVYLTESPQEAW